VTKKSALNLLACVIALQQFSDGILEDLDWCKAFWLTMTSATPQLGDNLCRYFTAAFYTILLISSLGIHASHFIAM